MILGGPGCALTHLGRVDHSPAVEEFPASPGGPAGASGPGGPGGPACKSHMTSGGTGPGLANGGAEAQTARGQTLTDQNPTCVSDSLNTPLPGFMNVECHSHHQ